MTYPIAVDARFDSIEALKQACRQHENRTCSCGEWEAQGFLYAHAIRVILTCNENPQLHIEPFYNLDAYKSTYANVIIHLQTSELETPPQFNGNRYKRTRIVDEEENGSGSEDEGESESESESDDTLMPPNTRSKKGAFEVMENVFVASNVIVVRYWTFEENV